MIRNFFLLILLSGSHIGHGQGQKISFDYLGPEHGLSQNSVFSILEDHQGFMWFGTEEGLNRYDGYDFKVYKKDLNDSNSLSYSIIWPLFEDSSQRLWVGTRGGGLSLFHRKSETFIRYQHQPGNPRSLSNDIVRAIGEDTSGFIWIGTEMGLNQLEPSDEEGEVHFQKFFHDSQDPSTISDNFIDDILVDQLGVLWIATQNGLNKYQNGTFVRYLQSYDGKGRNPNVINRIYEDDSVNIWLSTEAGLYAFNRLKNQFIRIESIPEINISCVLSDGTGKLWVGTEEQGIFVYDQANKNVLHLSHDPNDPSSLRDDWVRDIFMDRSGIIWIGTYGGAINRYDPQKFKFKHYTRDPNNINSLTHEILWEIYEDPPGVLWLGTFRGGLNKFEKNAGIFTHYMHDPANPYSISHNDIRTVIRDSAGRLWIATWGGGINQLIEGPQGVRFKRFQHNPANSNSISNDRAWVIFEDKQGILWIGTNGGVNRFDPETGQFTHYINDPKDPNSISDNSIRSIAQDQQGNLWFGTFNGGINRFDKENQRFISFKKEAGNDNSINNNFINTFYIDDDQTIWMGTRSGLNKMTNINSDNPSFSNYTELDGLPNNVVYGILEDDENHLWLTTNNGLSRFNKANEEFRNFTEKDGLQNKEFNWGAFHKSASGELYVGGINGYNVFRPQDIHDNQYLPPVYITQFNLLNQPASIATVNGNGAPVFELSFPFTKEITLAHRDYFFSFEFTALNYTHSTSNQYAYMMEGFDEDWINVGNRRFATYTNLDPGQYHFKVKGSNNDGVWNDNPASVMVTILPPWWATWWAYILYTFVGIGFIWGYLSYRENIHKGRLKQQEAELRAQTAEAEAKAISVAAMAKIDRVKVEERERLREQNSRDFHDELGHKLTKITMFLELAKRAQGAKDDLKKYLNKVEENTKDLSGGMRDFIWVLDPKKDTIYDLVLRLKDFGDKLFDHSGISFQLLGLSDKMQDHKVNSETRRHIVMLFKEAMNNCLKYSNCEKAILEVSLMEEHYTIVFNDDGQGFDLNENRQGYGLNNMKTRAARINHILEIKTNPNVGTTIMLTDEAPPPSSS